MYFTRIRLTVFSIATATCAVLIAIWLFSPTSDASSARLVSPESEFVAAINDYRVQAGVQPLRVDPTMAASADAWSAHMVARSYVGHAAIAEIQAQAPAAQSKAAENVGRGSTVDSLLAAFMQSPAHRANILDPAFTHIGVGVQMHPSSRKLYTTHRFASVPVAPTPQAAKPAEPPAATLPSVATATPVHLAPVATSAPTAMPRPVPTALPAGHPLTDEPSQLRNTRLDQTQAKADRGSRRSAD